MGKVQLPNNGGLVNIIAGKLNEVTGPAFTYSPVNLFDIKLNRGGEFNASVPAEHNTALLVINGSVEVNDKQVAEHSFVLFAMMEKTFISKQLKMP